MGWSGARDVAAHVKIDVFWNWISHWRRRRRRRRANNSPIWPDPWPMAHRDEISRSGIPHFDFGDANCRLVHKRGVINYQKSDFSLKIDILLHNWASKWIYSIRYDAYLYCLFWMPRKHLYLRPQINRRSRPPKAADFFGRFFVFCTDVSWASKIKNIDRHHI